MRWWKKLRTLLPFSSLAPSHEAVAAQQAATVSQIRAQNARVYAAAQRAAAEEVAATIRAHNTANHYDSFLQRIVRGDE